MQILPFPSETLYLIPSHCQSYVFSIEVDRLQFPLEERKGNCANIKIGTNDET